MNKRVIVDCNLPDLNRQKKLKNSLERWKIYAMHKSSRHQAVHKAVYSYNVRLKQKALNSLLINRIEAKRAQLFYKSLSIELDERPQFEKAREFERRRILKRACKAWSIYTSNRRGRKALNSAISDLRNEVFLRKYIKDWRFTFLERKQNFELEKKAIELYRYVLLRKFLRLWLDAHNHRLAIQTQWENAILHYQRKLLTNIWFAWIKYCNIKIERANKIEEIRKFYERKLLGRSLKILSSNVNVAIEKRRNHEKATNHHANRLSGRVFHAWTSHHRKKREFKNKISVQRKKIEDSSRRRVLKEWRLYVWRKKCCRRKNNISTSHYNRKLARRIISSFNSYSLYRKEKSIRLRYLKFVTTQISLDVLRVHVDKWRIAVVCIAQERQKIRRAEDHWRSRQIELYFFIWRQFSKRYKLQAKRKNMLKEIGRTVLLNKYVNLWFQKYEAIARTRVKETRAIAVYEKKIQFRLFRSWKRRVDEKLIKRNEFEEARKFHRKMLLREGLKEILRMCLYKTESRYEKQLRYARKNSTEDFDTVRKFFARWLSIVSNNENNPKTRDQITLRKKKSTIYEFPRGPRRLVLPEYMLRNTRIDNRDCHDDFYADNGFKDTCRISELKNKYSSSFVSKYANSENSPSSSHNITNSSTRISSVLENALK